jgi:hypothetical protein
MASLERGIYKKVIFISLMALTISLFFQNCSSNLDNSLVSSKVPPKTFSMDNADEVPFAFDTLMNEVAYMSCAHIDSDFNSEHMSKYGTYFSFKIGATGTNSGVGLRSEFRSYLSSNYGDANEVIPSDIVEKGFIQTPQNAWPALLFANRPMSDPASVVYSVSNGGDGPSFGGDYDIALSGNATYSSLIYGDNLKQVKELMSKPTVTRINYFLQQGTSHSLTATLNYHMATEYTITTAEAVRSRFSDGQNSNLLTMTYTRDLRETTNQQSPYVSRRTFSSTDFGSSVWGRGYKPSFGQDPRIKGLIGTTNNVLSQVEEFDLSSGLKPVTATWTCNIRYLIISPYDNDTSGNTYPTPYGSAMPTFERCMDAQDSELNATQKAEVAQIQRHLSSTDWIINPINKCVVPRTGNGDCYQKRRPNATNPIIYTKYVKTTEVTNCGVGTPYACPEFLSICTRN